MILRANYNTRKSSDHVILQCNLTFGKLVSIFHNLEKSAVRF